MATTRLGLNGFTGRPAGSFADKEGTADHPVGIITRLGLNGFGVRRNGSFADRAETPTIVVPPQVKIPGTGGGGRYEPGYTKQREDALAETRRRRILQEDEEVIALIMAMVTEGLI